MKVARVSGLDAGGDDFLGKPFAIAELRARVRALGRRRGSPTALSWTGAGVALDFPRRQATVALVEVPLTAREWRILEVLALLHRAGVVHGAVLPPHLFVQRADHGVRLVGYGFAGAPGSRRSVLPD